MKSGPATTTNTAIDKKDLVLLPPYQIRCKNEIKRLTAVKSKTPKKASCIINGNNAIPFRFKKPKVFENSVGIIYFSKYSQLFLLNLHRSVLRFF